jgi:hypothetical protein
LFRALATNTSIIEVLRRPVESTLFPARLTLFGRKRKASHIPERAILDERPMAPVVPLWMWREHSAQTRFIGPGRPMARPDRV